MNETYNYHCHLREVQLFSVSATSDLPEVLSLVVITSAKLSHLMGTICFKVITYVTYKTIFMTDVVKVTESCPLVEF